MQLSPRAWKIGALVLLATGLLAARAYWSRSSRSEPQLPPDVQEFPGPIVQVGDYRLSGPYTHRNLTVFLIHATDEQPEAQYLTLQEAVEQHKAIVHETGQVNELTVENLSSADEIYIQSGDIVKGGQQDRTLHYDLVVGQKSGKVPLASFCVEHGRWSQRGEEKVNLFYSSDSCLSSKELKLATRYEENQNKVWAKVAATRARLKEKLGTEVQASESTSSLALTLDSNRLQESVQPYLDGLTPTVAAHADVVGYVSVINGQFNSAEVYGSNRLFRQLWPKLLQASAVEALAEQRDEPATDPLAAEVVRSWLADAEAGKAYLRPAGDRMETVLQEGNQCLLFETWDRQKQGAWVHRTYLAK